MAENDQKEADYQAGLHEAFAAAVAGARKLALRAGLDPQVAVGVLLGEAKVAGWKPQEGGNERAMIDAMWRRQEVASDGD